MISRDSAKVLVLDAVSLLGQGVIYMINLALVYYLRYSNGIPSGIVGLAASTYTLAFFLGCMFLYPIYARFSGHVLIGASFLGMSLAILALLQAEAIWLIFLCLALYGLFMSLLWAPLEAWLMDSADERSINGILGSFNLSWSLGVGLSPLITTWIVSMDPRNVFIIGIAVFVMLWLTTSTLARFCRPARPSSDEKSIDPTIGAASRRVLAIRVISWSVAFMAYAVQAILLNIFPMFAKDILGVSDQMSGTILFLRGMAACASFFFLSHTSWWQLRFSRILGAEALIAILMIVLSASRSIAVIAISILIYGLVFSLCASFSSFHSACGIGDKVRTMRIHEGVINLGSVVGTALGGVIYERAGYSAVWLMLIIMLVLLASVQIAYYLHETKEERYR